MAKYNSYDTITAKVFFEILTSPVRNYQLLKPKPNEKTAELEAIYTAIHDEWFIKTDNDDANDYMKLSNELKALDYKKRTIKRILKLIFDQPVNLWNDVTVKEMRDSWIDAINKHLFTPINKDGVMIDELNQALQVEIGIIDNDISMAEIKLKNLVKVGQNKTFDYYDSIANMGSALPGNNLVKDNMTLAAYTALEKLAIKMNPPKAAA